MIKSLIVYKLYEESDCLLKDKNNFQLNLIPFNKAKRAHEIHKIDLTEEILFLRDYNFSVTADESLVITEKGLSIVFDTTKEPIKILWSEIKDISYEDNSYIFYLNENKSNFKRIDRKLISHNLDEFNFTGNKIALVFKSISDKINKIEFRDFERIIKLKKENKSIFEKFGIFYLNVFEKISNRSTNFKEFSSDDKIKKKTKFIFTKSILLTLIVSIFTVAPAIFVDLHFQNESFWTYWTWLISVSLVAIIIELYFLFLIALKLVHDLHKLLNLDSYSSELISIPTFNVKNILARTALEIPDPELEVLGIDPFKIISRRNLMIISAIYKGKIFLSNLIIKYILLITFGKMIFGFSILYEAVFVECFWNIVVLRKVLIDARLRLFGLKLSYEIIEQFKKSKIKNHLSLSAQKGCIRAIGNSVVMSKNYHPNMIFLLVYFQKELNILEPDHFDDWNLFIETLNKVNNEERFFLLDLFTVATAFDGTISSLESKNIEEAYGESLPKYIDRLEKLIYYLQKGYFYKALDECHLDFKEG